MTGSAAPPGSGENTLTVSQSSGSAPGATGAEGESSKADWGGGGPNMAASRTPSQGRAGCGAANRRAPTGGWANGMPRKTATPFSTRPRTCPAAARTTGSVTSIRTPSRAMSRKHPGADRCGRQEDVTPPGREGRLEFREARRSSHNLRNGACVLSAWPRSRRARRPRPPGPSAMTGPFPTFQDFSTRILWAGRRRADADRARAGRARAGRARAGRARAGRARAGRVWPMAADLILHEGDLGPDGDYEGMLFDGASFTYAEAGHSHFLDSSFLKVAFDGGRLRKARFTDVTLRETRFMACDLAETGWQDVTLADCALAGVQAFSAS